MKSLQQIVKEELALKRINEAGENYADSVDADLGTVAEYFVDDVGNLDDTVAIRDFFIKNGITDLQKRKKILQLAKKKLSGK